MEPLVTARWLADALDTAPDVRVLDASCFLPEHGRDAAADYAAGHIPGALFLDLPTFRDRDNPLPSTFPPPELVASRMRALGVGDGSRIVLYDDSPLHSAARAWFILNAHGIPGLALLDGGLAAWKAAGLPLETAAPRIRERHFTLRRPAQGLRDKEQVAHALSNGSESDESAQVVDARSPARFAGEEAESRPGLAAGHMPGARNLPYARLFHADGTWKRGDALRTAFEEAGIDIDRPVITSCGSGITACVLAFGLHLLGRDAMLYDGSWAEWGADPDTPKEQGRSPAPKPATGNA